MLQNGAANGSPANGRRMSRRRLLAGRAAVMTLAYDLHQTQLLTTNAGEWVDSDFFGGMDCFRHRPLSSHSPADAVQHVPRQAQNPFQQFVNARLEALDRAFTHLCCVATVQAVRGEYVQVHFDGWGPQFDYWCHYTSPEIQPIGTCQRLGLLLQTPSTGLGLDQQWRAGGSTWQGYLSTIGAAGVPADVFTPPYRAECSLDVPPLHEFCVKALLLSLDEGTVDTIVPSGKLACLPKGIVQQLTTARRCGWCSGPFLYGYKCTEPFTADAWLHSLQQTLGRTATVCSHQCAEALTYRRRTSLSSTHYANNEKLHMHLRQFFLAPAAPPGDADNVDKLTTKLEEFAFPATSPAQDQPSDDCDDVDVDGNYEGEYSDVITADNDDDCEVASGSHLSSSSPHDDPDSTAVRGSSMALQQGSIIVNADGIHVGIAAGRQVFIQRHAKLMVLGFKKTSVDFPALFLKAHEWKDSDYCNGVSCFADYQGAADDAWRNRGLIDPSVLQPPTKDNHFVAGMRLEALDRKFPRLVCVATVLAVSGDRVLIYFDGWSHDYDYWCRFDSPEIRPAGTCQRLGLSLHAPSRVDNRSNTWDRAGKSWQGYVNAVGAMLAPPDAFLPLVRPESNNSVLSLADVSLRQFLLSLRKDVLCSLASNGALARLPSTIRSQILAARLCAWCGEPFLTGFKCVDAFTSQLWLAKPNLAASRTATTCSEQCGQALVYRDRHPYQTSNEFYFFYPRLFAVPRPLQTEQQNRCVEENERR